MYINIDKETKKKVDITVKKYYHFNLRKYFIRPIKYVKYYNTVIVFYVLGVRSVYDGFEIHLGYFIYNCSERYYLSMDTMNSYLILSHNKLVKRKTSKLKDISFKTAVTVDMIERTLDNLRDYYEEQTACEEFITTEDVLNTL